jgi:DNA uptake protein ComE-like DNA-binding protein
LNINTVTKEQLLGLPEMVEEIADAIIDWRDSDDMISGTGVESGYYEGLTYGYMARNAPFRTLREMLLVKDVSDDLFYREDTNLNGRLDYNERDGQDSPPADNGDNVLDVGWAAYLTCYPTGSGDGGASETSGGQTQSSGNQQQNSGNDGRSSGNSGQTSGNSGQTSGSTNPEPTKVNINTASDIVLAALLGGGDQAERTAQEIITYRNTLAEGIEDISELTEQGVLSNNIFEQLEEYITTSSDIFMIRCIATADRNGAGGMTLQTEAVVDRSSKPCKILYWYQGAN